MKVMPITGTFPSKTIATAVPSTDTATQGRTGTPPVSAGAPSEPLSTGEQPLKRSDLERAVDKLKDTVRVFSRQLQFEVVDSNRLVIRVLDSDSGEVIREIPPETLMKALDRMEEAMGALLDRKV